LPILSGLIFFFIEAVVVVEIDRQVYQDKKKEICIANWERICPSSLVEKLAERAQGYFNLVDRMRNVPAERVQLMRQSETARTALDEETSHILHQDNSLISISVFTVQYRNNKRIREPVVSNEMDKYARQNTFANSLVLRRFWGESTIPCLSPYPTSARVGEIVFRYTTPLGIPEINNLTSRYRLYLAAVVLAVGLLYWYILRHLIMPIKIVTESIDRSKGAMPKVLPHPRTMLEAAYNDLARDALLNSVTRMMAEYMSVDRLVSRDEIAGHMPEVIAPNFGFAAVYALELVVDADSESPVRWRRSAMHESNDTRIPPPTDNDWSALGRQFDLDWSQTILDFSVSDGHASRPYFAVPVATDREQRRAVFLAATPLGPLSQEGLRWQRETLLRLAGAIRAGLETLDMQRDLIVREKSKANISLSRNLGHDLTNVIATSKLELDTVRRFLKLPPARQTELDPPLRALFTESLQGLLHNTKFLQEIINIYRSFSYMRHPEYEWVDPNVLVDEVAELFQLSLSRRIRIHRSYGSDVPQGYFEPRLLKLAMFNLLTNATDALKRRAMHEGDYGAALWVTTTYDGPSKTVTLAVRDNGLGICNPRGEPATPDEIRAVFQGGFTTKSEGMAEGLGLNWVRQIVYDFHRGQLRACNHPEGGAEVSLVLPRYESPPNLEGFGGAVEAESARVENPSPVAEVKP
jgi:signal transduction histidine kinase